MEDDGGIHWREGRRKRSEDKFDEESGRCMMQTERKKDNQQMIAG